MNSSSPWDDIAVPSADYNVRQIAGTSIIPCYWGRDSASHCLLIVELSGDHFDQFRKNAIRVNGIDVDLRQGATADTQKLVLTLERQVDRDLFEGMCQTLVSAVGLANDSATALAVAQTHIKRWKAFLAGKGGHHLSPEEVRGLFAEIMFLRELHRTISKTAAVEAWLGPERSHQDFIFGNTAVEIKSLSGRERSKVRISSEDQLESLNDELFLRVYRLSDLPEAEGALSLNALIDLAGSELGEAEAVEAFHRKLLAHRYAPLPEYDEPWFVIPEIRTYRVVEAFPRLARSGLPNGISGVTYDIELESIAAFKCPDDAVFGEA